MLLLLLPSYFPEIDDENDTTFVRGMIRQETYSRESIEETDLFSKSGGSDFQGLEWKSMCQLLK